MCIVLYIYRPAKFVVVVFKASMLVWLGGSSAIGICALFYKYIYRSAKFGVALFKVSMLEWLVGQCAIGICSLFYIYIYIDLPS